MSTSAGNKRVVIMYLLNMSVACVLVILGFGCFKRNGCPIMHAALFIILCASLMGIEPIDPDRPVYQTNWAAPEWAVKIHPGMEEKQYISPDEVVRLEKERFEIINRQKLMDRGMLFLTWGIPLAICAFLFQTMLKQYGLQMVCHFGFPLGLGLTGSGLMFRELVKLEMAITAGIVLMVVYGIISIWRKDKGLEIQLPRIKKKKREATNGQ